MWQFVAHTFMRRARTRIIKHTHHPVWEEAFQVPVADEVKEVGFLLKDASYFGIAFRCIVHFPLLPRCCMSQIQASGV